MCWYFSLAVENGPSGGAGKDCRWFLSKMVSQDVAPNRDGQTEGRTEPCLTCTVTPLLLSNTGPKSLVAC